MKIKIHPLVKSFLKALGVVMAFAALIYGIALAAFYYGEWGLLGSLAILATIFLTWMFYDINKT